MIATRIDTPGAQVVVVNSKSPCGNSRRPRRPTPCRGGSTKAQVSNAQPLIVAVIVPLPVADGPDTVVTPALFTTWASVDEAAWWFVQMERCCEAQLRAEAVAAPTRFKDADARWIAAKLGSEAFGWLSFQTLWDDIVASDPDLFG